MKRRRSWLGCLAAAVGLLVVLVIATLAILGGMLAWEGRVQRELVAQLRGQGAQVRYDWQLARDGQPGRTFPPGNPVLRGLLGNDAFQRIGSVDFRRTTMISRPHWQRVVSSRGLRWLAAVQTGVSNSDLEQLDPDIPLETAILSSNPIGDPGVAALAQVKSLRRIDLADTSVTDSGLAALANLPQLESLDLSGLDLTDAAVGHLERLTTLRELRIQDTGLSAQAIQQLRAALPETEIID